MNKLGNSAGGIGVFRRNNLRASLVLIFLACLMGLAPAAQVCAQGTASDTTTTPFRKGKWLSGLNGSFSSSTLKLESEDELFSTNSYGIEIFTGKFFKDRWFAGFNVIAISSSGAGLIERESESLLIGPSISHYFLKESYGSLYVSVLPGYIRIREQGSVFSEGDILNQVAEGPGFATRIRLGYSYVISRRIVLDVGVGTNLAWLDLSYISEIENVTRKESIFSNGTFFSFGFNVLLDEFFF
ncbi:MAG: hypothetical protein ACO20F_11290 [Robiginitalea sp.]|jgi:hypothetical protein